MNDRQPDLWMVNDGFELKGGQRPTAAKLDRRRRRAAFRSAPRQPLERCRRRAGVRPLTPADWLIRNPAAFDGKEPFVDATLHNAEKVFAVIGSYIQR